MKAFYGDCMQFVIFCLWISMAILTGGYARTRGRDAWPWFVYALFTGPIAIYLIVVWPPRKKELSTDPAHKNS